MNRNFRLTKSACYTGYVIQAIVNNFAPLLFVTFNSEFGISLEKITFISAFNFIIQLSVDIFSAALSDRIGYRISIVSAQVLSAVGLASFSIFPYILPSPFAGILISTALCAVGSGQIEVLVSPIVEACPSDSKSGSMSLLHSFYCWGQATVVLFSSLMFDLIGISNWRFISLIWSAVPAVNSLLFAYAPIPDMPRPEEKSHYKYKLISDGRFRLLIVLMLCAGASELAVSQWVSAFAETALNISKSLGDLVGPCIFALIMGTSRLLYSMFSLRISLTRTIMYCSIACTVSYIMISLSPIPFVSLVGCALCGLSVGIMWPGTLSVASELFPDGGTFMYGILALAGDIGCVAGTASVGTVSGIFGDDLRIGFLAASIFPLCLSSCMIYYRLKKTDL